MSQDQKFILSLNDKEFIAVYDFFLFLCEAISKGSWPKGRPSCKFPRNLRNKLLKHFILKHNLTLSPQQDLGETEPTSPQFFKIEEIFQLLRKQHDHS
jgi:hypothetical protein